MLCRVKTLPTGVLLLNGVFERVRLHYHLLENAIELGAYPLLSQQAHWHYFEKCAQANAEDLLRKNSKEVWFWIDRDLLVETFGNVMDYVKEST